MEGHNIDDQFAEMARKSDADVERHMQLLTKLARKRDAAVVGAGAAPPATTTAIAD